MINRKIKIFLIIFAAVFCKQYFCQNIQYTKNESEYIQYPNPDLFLKRTTIIDRSNYVTHGFLVGIKGDSLILTLQNKSISYPLHNILSIAIDVESQNYKGFLMGTLLGIYTGSLAFFSDEGQPFSYMEDHENASLIIFGTIFAFAGGGIGYLIEQGINKDQVKFFFTGDKTEYNSELKRFKESIFNFKRKNLIHISVNLAQVHTRLSELGNGEYYSFGTTSFNLLRSLDINYDFYKNISAGISINWFGEPKIFYNNYSNFTSKYTWIEQHFEGVGYYLVSSYTPFSTESFHAIAWKVGVGLGIGTIDYRLKITTDLEIEGEYSSSEVITNISKYKVSALFFTHLNLYLYESLSIGLSADYVYLNEKMPAITEAGLPSRNFGNYSIGANLSLHF